MPLRIKSRIRESLLVLLVGFPADRAFAQPNSILRDRPVPTLEEAVTSKADVWGDAAVREPGGPSYEFFEKLLPPPRYVNADFKHYPIVLSAPKSKVKARLISNGSAVNAHGGTRSWNENGTPVIFRVGPDELRFGEFPKRIDGPRYAEGYLPIVQVNYAHGEAVYREEAFASVEPMLADHGVVLARFSMANQTNGPVAIQIDSKSALKVENGTVRDEQGRTLLWFDSNWKWVRQRLVATASSKKEATIAVATKPLDAAVPSPLNAGGYARQRSLCVDTWRNILSAGMQLEVPEPIVNNAWRSLIIGNFSLINGDRIHYSAGNQYDRLYEGEGCDATHALLVWGFASDVRRLIVPLLDFTRKGLEYHQAGHKLLILTHYFWLTRDAEFIRAQEPRWGKEVARIVDGRTNEHGLFPREQYCGDVATPVFSLNSNAKCWRGLRDIASLLAELGDRDQAGRLAGVAAEFRKNIFAAVEKSERRDVQPPFIPIALFGEEQPYDAITATKIGSYYDLMAPYVIGSRVFGPGSDREKWMLDYLQQRGGLCMGLTRSRPNPTFWTGPHSINPLYGLRRMLILLERDEPESVLVSFYGMLAQGMTRDTFIGGEGCSLAPLDEHGRLFYCPPNSASNGFFLWMLRSLLVQDSDLDDDGRPETLRLLFATPRRWMEEGKTIRVQNAPTAFGPVSMRIESRLNAREVIAEIEMPQRESPKRTLLRIRVPEGWRVTSAKAGTQTLTVDPSGTADISSLKGNVTMRFEVEKVQSR